MFFIGIFGIESKEKEIGYAQNIGCKNCSCVNLQIIKVYDFFHFFFIPLFKWNIRYYAICKNCGSVYNISKENGENFERGNKNAITYWELKDCEVQRDIQKRCENCKRIVEENYEYCPYCGKKMRK